MMESRRSDNCQVPDPTVEYWYRLWERAYSEHHPLVATYALLRGSARVDGRIVTLLAKSVRI